MHKLYQSLMGNRNPVQNNTPVNSNLQTIKNLFSVLNGSTNPMQLLMGFASKNPIIKNTMDVASQSGKSYEQIFYDLAKEKGVDPNQILNQLKF